MVAVARYGSLLGRQFAVAAALWLVCLTGYAQSSPSAHEVVTAATQNVMAVVDSAREYADEDPDRYYLAIDEILAPVIDYRGFARSVMGAYATGDRFRSLDKEGQALLRSQLERFTAIMRTGLVATYSKGLMAFSGSRIEVSDPSEEEAAKSRVSVQQLIYSEESQPYVLIYQMALNKGKQWKLRNIIIESVNLGEIYRNQFQSAARKYDGDLDAVIDNWST
jgi:phospholipid transport system substrate-binding protein